MRTSSGGPRTRPGLGSTALPAPHLARAITLFVLSCYATVTLLNVLLSGAAGTPAYLAWGCVALIYGLQVVHTFPHVHRWSASRRATTLGAQAVLTYLPLLAFGLNWGSMAGPLGGSLLLLVPGRAAWLLFASVVGSIAAVAVGHGVPAVDLAYYTIATAMAGVIIFGMTRLADLVSEVHSSRRELARMAVLQERNRFARDLHDLLGYSLSSVTLKSELTYRLIATRPERARQEVAEVLEVSRQALADVRLVASSYRDMSLAAEGSSVVDILSAAGIRAEVDVDCGELHPSVDTVLATVLREGVTNILRHSKSRHCTVVADSDGETVRLTIVNDGARGRPHGATAVEDGSPGNGSGIGNLRSRLAEVGGSLRAGREEDGHYRMVATSPVRPPQRAEPREADTSVA